MVFQQLKGIHFALFTGLLQYIQRLLREETALFTALVDIMLISS
jgi:hypothetical protein